jgi:hypothetical protein
VIYLVDRDNLGKYGLNNNVVQNTPSQLSGSFDTAAYYQGRIYYVEGNGGVGKTFTIANGTMSTIPETLSVDGFADPGSTASVSANGLGDGIVWDVDGGTNQLRAYSSDSYATELYTSAQAAGGRDSMGTAVKFQVPTIANGHVYIASGDGDPNDFLVVYGLLSPTVSSAAFIDETSPQRLTFSFSQDVSASLSLSDISVEHLGAGTVTPAGLSYDQATNTATVTLNGTLADGDYRATLNAVGITNSSGITMGANYVFDFSFVAGDANQDSFVNTLDFTTLAQNFNTGGATFSQGDFNYDGVVNALDFNILATKFGTYLASPALAVGIDSAVPQAAASTPSLFTDRPIADDLLII